MPTISRKKALSLIKESKGRFFTVVFVKKNGKDRVMNCKFMPIQDNEEIGYIKVKDVSLGKKCTSCIRSVNIQTLKSLKINGKEYKI